MAGKGKARFQIRRKKQQVAPATLTPSMALAVKKIANASLNKVAEHKVLDYFSEPIPLAALYHNVPSVLDNDMLYSTQGVFDEEIALGRNRIGDSIFVKNIQITLLLTCFSTRPNCLFRITVVKTKSGNATIPGGAAIYGHPQCGNLICAPLDTELEGIQSVVYDKVVSSLANQTAQDGNEDKKYYLKFSVPVNRKIKYENSGANANSHSYRLYLMAYDTQGALITDNIARYSYFRRTHFVDA